MSPSRIAAKMSPSLPVLAEDQPRRGDRREGRVAELVVARQRRRRPRGRRGRAARRPRRPGRRRSRARRPAARAAARSMSALDLEPHDLAEAPAAELLLDRLQQVVGLVGDVVVGVAGDPEERVVDAPPSRGTASRGWRRSARRAGPASSPRSPTCEEAAEQLLRHLDPGEDLVVLARGRGGRRRARARGSRCRGTAARGRSRAGSAPGRPGC